MGALQLQIPFTPEEYADMVIRPSRGKLVDDLSYWAAQKATMGVIRHDLTNKLEKTDEGYPIVHPYIGEFPKDLVEVGRLSKAAAGTWLNGFSEDVVLDRIWKRPAYYLNKIPYKGGLIAPDFSVKFHMSPIEKQYNVFRRNAIAAISQQFGIPAIVPLTWAEYASFEYCFNGIMPGGVYAISNLGTRNHFISRKIFNVGLKEAIRILNPRGLVLYGYPLDKKYNVKIQHYYNPHYKRIKNNVRFHAK